jgi:hypothetical protein
VRSSLAATRDSGWIERVMASEPTLAHACATTSRPPLLRGAESSASSSRASQRSASRSTVSDLSERSAGPRRRGGRVPARGRGARGRGGSASRFGRCASGPTRARARRCARARARAARGRVRSACGSRPEERRELDAPGAVAASRATWDSPSSRAIAGARESLERIAREAAEQGVTGLPTVMLGAFPSGHAVARRRCSCSRALGAETRASDW